MSRKPHAHIDHICCKESEKDHKERDENSRAACTRGWVNAPLTSECNPALQLPLDLTCTRVYGFGDEVVFGFVELSAAAFTIVG